MYHSYDQIEAAEERRFPWICAIIGGLWGISLSWGLQYSNKHYDLIKATIDGADTGMTLGPAILTFTLVSMLLIAVVFLAGLIFWRRRRGFWVLFLALGCGFAAGSIANRLSAA